MLLNASTRYDTPYYALECLYTLLNAIPAECPFQVVPLLCGSFLIRFTYLHNAPIHRFLKIGATPWNFLRRGEIGCLHNALIQNFLNSLGPNFNHTRARRWKIACLLYIMYIYRNPNFLGRLLSPQNSLGHLF